MQFLSNDLAFPISLKIHFQKSKMNILSFDSDYGRSKKLQVDQKINIFMKKCLNSPILSWFLVRFCCLKTDKEHHFLTHFSLALNVMYNTIHKSEWGSGICGCWGTLVLGISHEHSYCIHELAGDVQHHPLLNIENHCEKTKIGVNPIGGGGLNQPALFSKIHFSMKKRFWR